MLSINFSHVQHNSEYAVRTVTVRHYKYKTLKGQLKQNNGTANSNCDSKCGGIYSVDDNKNAYERSDRKQRTP